MGLTYSMILMFNSKPPVLVQLYPNRGELFYHSGALSLLGQKTWTVIQLLIYQMFKTRTQVTGLQTSRMILPKPQKNTPGTVLSAMSLWEPSSCPFVGIDLADSVRWPF